jgi:hypothetical protein
MKILVTPEDLVKRCVWDGYVYYILGSDKEGEKLLSSNLEFEISERDALVIGLLKIIETPNLIHKFNTYLVDFLGNKSINHIEESGDTSTSYSLVRKKSTELIIDKFLDKFPDYWIPNDIYKKSLSELVEYIDDIKEKINTLEVFKITDKFGTHEFISSTKIKKSLSFNY